MAITTINSTDSGATSRTTINDNFTDLDTTKADLASPTFTGTPVLPTGTTGVTQTASDNSTKLATTAYVDTAASTVTIETTTGATHSLTTNEGQKVVVWGKCNYADNGSGGGNYAITLAYNGVSKDVAYQQLGNTTNKYNFATMYTETPGAGTQNITLTKTAGPGGAMSEAVIIVMKIG